MNKVAIIQARMTSSRLPGKVLLDIAGKPMLQHVIERARQASLVDQVVVATTKDPTDDILEEFCQTQGVTTYRGSLADVLDRFYQAACQFKAEVVIRLTADCPLLDPDVLDRTIALFLGNPNIATSAIFPGISRDFTPITDAYDFAANRLPPPWKRTLPIGLDVEVCSLGALQRAWKEAGQAFQREHVLPYLYEGVEFTRQDTPANEAWNFQHNTTPRGFRVALLNHNPDYGALRWTVDTAQDLEFVRQVYNHLAGQTGFGWGDILTLLEEKPELCTINAGVRHKSAFDVDQRTIQS